MSPEPQISLTMNTLWVVCPVYFDVDSFLVLQARIRNEFARLDFDAPGRLRLVAIDDSGGQDPEIARLGELPNVTVLPTPFNLGHQAALVFGLRRLASEMNTEDWVVTLDADGEDQPADCPRLLRKLRVVNLVILFVVSVQFRSLSMRGLHEKALGLNEGQANRLEIDTGQLLRTPADVVPNYQSVNQNPSTVREQRLRT